jgi:hypothetical protein
MPETASIAVRQRGKVFLSMATLVATGQAAQRRVIFRDLARESARTSAWTTGTVRKKPKAEVPVTLAGLACAIFANALKFSEEHSVIGPRMPVP